MRADSYAVITPVRNECENLDRVAETLGQQDTRPTTWVIVDTGSDDGTDAHAARLAEADDSVRVLTMPIAPGRERAPAIVQGFEAAVASLDPRPPVIAKLDADVTLPTDYFARLLEEMRRDARLGIVGGSCHEKSGGTWRQRFGTGASVWGAARAYRWACLEQLLPLERRTGWDFIDVAEADVLGWTTGTLLDLPFYHHREEGARERSRRHAWAAEGRASHYLRYRPSYLAARSLYHGLRDPAALAMLPAFAAASVRRDAQCDRAALVTRLRERQRLRHLHRRAGEAIGRRGRADRVGPQASVENADADASEDEHHDGRLYEGERVVGQHAHAESGDRCDESGQ
jgi:glycosyltransferase involved in cell wall biosynthesis